MSNLSLAGAALLVAVLACLAVVVLVISRFGKRRNSAQTVELSEPAVDILRGAGRRALTAVAFAAVVCVSLGMAGLALPALLGLPILLAAPLAAVAGLLLYVSTPPTAHRFKPTEIRSASLTPREPGAYLSPRLTLPPLVALAVLVVFVVFAGVTASPDDLGFSRSIAFSSEDQASSSSPYAGWFYGAPLLGACAAVVAVAILTLRRISAAPALPGPALHNLDGIWRRESMRIVSAITVFAVTLPLGGAAAISGRAMLSAVFPGVGITWTVLGIGLLIGGAICLVLAALSITVAARRALVLPRSSMSAVGMQAIAFEGAGTQR